MHIDLMEHPAALLKNGDVLVVGGGQQNSQTLASAELYLAKKH